MNGMTTRLLAVLLGAIALLLPAPSRAASAQGEDREQRRAALESLLPEAGSAPGLELSSGPRFFGPGTLWEYIDGEAEYYLRYGFRLVVTSACASGVDRVPLGIDIYEMESPLHAFGIYAAERSPEERFVQMGVEGYLGKDFLNFWKGPFYVKLSAGGASPATEETLLKLAGEIAGKISGGHSQPGLLAYLPEKEQVGRSERYIPRDFLGQSFLTNAYRADYEGEGGSYRVFLVENGSTEEAVRSYGKYRDSLRSRGATISHEKEGNSPSFRAGNGSVQLIFVYRTILGGILNVEEFSEAEAIAGGITARLRERAGSSN
jgi:hypothetical protein